MEKWVIGKEIRRVVFSTIDNRNYNRKVQQAIEYIELNDGSRIVFGTGQTEDLPFTYALYQKAVQKRDRIIKPNQ